jgi:hypothetical protein
MDVVLRMSAVVVGKKACKRGSIGPVKPDSGEAFTNPKGLKKFDIAREGRTKMRK